MLPEHLYLYTTFSGNVTRLARVDLPVAFFHNQLYSFEPFLLLFVVLIRARPHGKKRWTNLALVKTSDNNFFDCIRSLGESAEMLGFVWSQRRAELV